MHVFGIDSGGTKTVCLLADERGRIISEGRGPGANLHTAGALAVEAVLAEVITKAIGDRDIVPAAICLGIAGVDREDEERTIRAIMERIGPRSRVLVVNDHDSLLTHGRHRTRPRLPTGVDPMEKL